MQKPSCTCFTSVDAQVFSRFIKRAIREGREYQKILKRVDRTEYMKRELELNEAELFLLALRK